ncbi:MAG TPA: transglycosylase, partial [Cryobacterium sp.]|nr:transglycosylase [Cryobacterium sp.]
TQIEWGLGYVTDRYGTPCGAWGHSEAMGWY